MVTVGAIPESPLGGRAVVDPVDVVGGRGSHVGVDTVYGLKVYLKFEP